MMPVLAIQNRRAKDRAPPPGFKVFNNYDWNNSAEKRKRAGMLSLANVAKVFKKLAIRKVTNTSLSDVLHSLFPRL